MTTQEYMDLSFEFTESGAAGKEKPGGLDSAGMIPPRIFTGRETLAVYTGLNYGNISN